MDYKDCPNYEAEKEWRRVLFAEIKELRKDLNGFKIKTIGFFTTLIAAVKIVEFYIGSK